jgi:hypothetical protein
MADHAPGVSVTLHGIDALRAQLRGWLENPRVNEVLLSRRVFTSAIEIGHIHQDMDQYNPRGLALITKKLLSHPRVRIRILAFAPDRKAGREAMDSLLAWAKEAAAFDPAAKAN